MAGNMENITGVLNPAEKNKGEEPIVIAQRYLNIFRQLHIFDDSRKAAFNQSLLDLPPEIRGMFSNLPGGSVLQEYVNNLERKAGITRDRTLNPAATASASSEEMSQAKILATALAEAQMQAAAQMQQAAPIMAPAAAGAAGPSKIVADAAFAEEIAKAVSAAIQHSDDTHRQEYSELIRAVTESQEKVAALLTSVHPAPAGAAAEPAPAATAPAAIQATAVSDEKIETLTKAVTDSQLQMAKMFLQFYNSKLANPEKLASAEITEAVTKAITDSQMQMAKMFLEYQENRPASAPVPAAGGGENIKVIDNSDAIVKAISESQKELVQLLMQHNTLNQSASTSSNANNIQINTAANFPPVEELVSGIVKAQSEIFREVAANQTKELTAIIGVALKESQQISTRTIVEALKGFHQENLKFWENQTTKTIAVPVYQAAPAPAVYDPPATSESAETVSAAAEMQPLPEEAVSAPAEDTPTQKKKKKKKKKKEREEVLGSAAPAADTAADDWDLSSLDIPEAPAELSAEESAAPENDAFAFDLPDDSFSYQPENEAAAPESSISAGGLDNSLFDFDTPAGPVFEATIPEPELSEQTAEDEMPTEIISAPEETVFSETESAAEPEADVFSEMPAPAKPSWKWAFDEEEKELMENADDLVDLDSYGSEPAETDVHKNIWLDDSFEDTPAPDEEPAEAAESMKASEETTDDAAQDWEWEYEEVPEEEAAQTGENAQDWEWEYEEVPEEETAAGDNAQDWEWEYEEAPEEEAAQTGENAQDWEWEYEEVPEEETADQHLSGIDSDAQDWEWEYEEVPEEETESQELTESGEKDPYSPLLERENDLLPDIKSEVLFDQPDILNPAVRNPENPAEENNLPPIIPELLEGELKNDPYQPNSDVK